MQNFTNDFYYIVHELISDITFAVWAHYITVSYSTHTYAAIKAAGLERKMTTSYSSFHLQHYVIDLEIYKAEKPTTFAQ